MNNIKSELNNLIKQTLIPEAELYLDELHKLLENKIATKNDINTIKDMESFLVELENILLALKKDKISNEKANEIYQNLSNMIEES